MDEIDRLKQFINRKKFTVDVLGELNRLLEQAYFPTRMGEVMRAGSNIGYYCIMEHKINSIRMAKKNGYG